MNKLLLTAFLSFVLTTSFAYQTAYGGIGGGGTVYDDGTVRIEPVRSLNPLVVYWNDNITIERDTTNDCGGDEPDSVKLILGPYSDEDAFDEFGEFGGEEFEINFEIFDFTIEILPKAYAGGTPTMIPMTMTSPNMYEASYTLHPQHGFGSIEFEIICPNTGLVVPNPQGPSIFVDPSGRILDCNTHLPIPGAEATLLDDFGNPGVFSVTPEFSGLFINPPNLPDNPQSTNPFDGTYQWFVVDSPSIIFPIPISWQVQASAPGYVSQIEPSPTTGFSIPLEVTGLDFFLQPIGGTCPSGIGGELLPIDSTALLLAGIQSSAMWILPIAFAGAGIAAFKLRKYWN